MENPFENMRIVFAVISLTIGLHTAAQHYHAVQGSQFAGSLGMMNNPASMLNTPIVWDVTLIGFQLKSATNIYTIHNYSLLSNPAQSEYGLNAGDYARRAAVSFNANLFNTRITLNRRQAIGFGMNVRGLTRIKTAPYNFIDTMGNSRDFFDINSEGRTLSARITGSNWIELFGSYARTLLDMETGRLNTGITVKVSRGIGGGHLTADNIRFRTQPVGNQRVNLLTGAQLSYGYSSNFDRWQTQKTGNENVRNLVTYTEGGASLDVGLEYFVKTQAVRTFEDDDDYYDYKWRLSASLLDIGVNQYKYGRESRVASGIASGIADTLLDDKFRTVGSLGEVNDSLATIVQNISALSGKFTVINPMRLVLNADRPLGNDFYVNAEVSLNLSSLFKKYYYVSEMNFITVTPRWETRRLGAYLPVQYNAEGKFWIGGAFKAGPLLLGVHNWANVFGKKSMQNGGGYIALVLRSWTDSKNKSDRRLNCPPPQ